MSLSSSRISGHGIVELIDPHTGLVVARWAFTNVVTRVGDQMYAERGAGILTAPAAPTGMRLGTGSTEPAKTGTAAAIGTYVSGSARPLDGGYPLSTLVGEVRRITYRCTWPAGTATTNGIAEVALTNQTGPAEGAGSTADTIARALLRPAVNKPESKALTVTWHHDVLGA